MLAFDCDRWATPLSRTDGPIPSSRCGADRDGVDRAHDRLGFPKARQERFEVVQISAEWIVLVAENNLKAVIAEHVAAMRANSGVKPLGLQEIEAVARGGAANTTFQRSEIVACHSYPIISRPFAAFSRRVPRWRYLGWRIPWKMTSNSRQPTVRLCPMVHLRSH